MPELQAYTGERQEVLVLPSTANKPTEEQATVTLSFRRLNGSDFNLLDEKAEKMDQVRALLESRFITTNITQNGEPIGFAQFWAAVQPEDLTFVGEQVTDHLKTLKAAADEKKTIDTNGSLNTSAA